MELDIWRGDWSLPSIDIECLKIMTFAKISGAPIKVRPTNNPFKTPKGSLPVLRCGKLKVCGYDGITGYLKSQDFNADKELSGPEISLIEAYAMHTRIKLLPGLIHTWWVDVPNFTDCIRPLYAKALPFPLNYIYPGRYEREAKELMDTLHGDYLNEKQIAEAVIADAQKCITMLSTKLGNSQYFLGEAPCSLDCIVFAYLAPLLKAPLLSCTLKNHLIQCTNLVQFVNRILNQNFPECQQDMKHISKENEQPNNQKTREKGQGDSEDFPNKTRSTILAALVAFVAMGGYALSTGILQISSNNDNAFSDGMFEDEDAE